MASSLNGAENGLGHPVSGANSDVGSNSSAEVPATIRSSGTSACSTTSSMDMGRSRDSTHCTKNATPNLIHSTVAATATNAASSTGSSSSSCPSPSSALPLKAVARGTVHQDGGGTGSTATASGTTASASAASATGGSGGGGGPANVTATASSNKQQQVQCQPQSNDGKPWNYSSLDIMATGAFWQNYSGEFLEGGKANNLLSRVIIIIGNYLFNYLHHILRFINRLYI